VLWTLYIIIDTLTYTGPHKNLFAFFSV